MIQKSMHTGMMFPHGCRRRTLPALIAGAVMLLVTVIGSDAQSPDGLGQIRIDTSPAGATVHCDGTLYDATPTTLSGLKAGDHLLVVSKPGYRELRRTVSLKDGQKVAIELSLDPLTALLLIKSSPDGASVEVGGAHRGTTPLLITDLPLGQYRARLTNPGYQPREVDLNLSSRAPAWIDVELVSDSSTLFVDSTPPGATVRVNGLDRGLTPCRVDRIPNGDVQVEFTLDGFAPQTRALTLSEGREESVNVTLVPLPATLQVVSIPAQARVYVDNQFQGPSPIEVKNLQPGNYRIKVELDGYDPQARTVTLGRGSCLVEEFRLKGNVGMLEITTEPAGVKVFVAGKDSGTTLAKPDETDRISQPLQVDFLPVGRHPVQLTKPGYFTKDIEIVVERDKTVNVHEELNRRFIPNYVVVTSDGNVHKGVFVEVTPEAAVRIEIMPGIFKTIPPQDIRRRHPLRHTLGDTSADE